ncbi:hypothetical protein MKW92_014729 [Papaver armeniacum]|nr:hypothetical protein MKW92_014729 [Papaver armeniacum]
MAVRRPGLIALFDVDGTLTAPRKEVTPKMLEFMRNLRKEITVGVVGGSDLVKITEQLGKSVLTDYDYVFSENGLVAHKDGKLIGTESLKSFIANDQLKEFINFTLHYIADLDIPIKSQAFSLLYLFILMLILTSKFQIHNVRPKMVSGGNDHEIYESERTVGRTVTSPDDTTEQCTALFLAKQD